MNDLALLLDLFGNSEETKLLICTAIFVWCLQRHRNGGLNSGQKSAIIVRYAFFPFTPIIMKLHTQTPHVLKMCPINFRVKRSNVKVTALNIENGNWHIIACPLHIQLWNFTHRLHISQGYARKSVISWIKNFESLNWLPRGVLCPVRTAPF